MHTVLQANCNTLIFFYLCEKTVFACTCLLFLSLLKVKNEIRSGISLLRKIERFSSPGPLNGHQAGGITCVFDAFHQIFGFEPDSGGVVVEVDADDPSVFGKSFI